MKKQEKEVCVICLEELEENEMDYFTCKKCTTFIKDKADEFVKKNCNHENEKLHQGDGFVYKTCADCGEDI